MKSHRQLMLDGMCEWSQDSDVLQREAEGIFKYKNKNISFKPGLGDRLIFKRLVDRDIKHIREEASPKFESFQLTYGIIYGIGLLSSIRLV